MSSARERLGRIRRQLLGLRGLDPHLAAIEARLEALEQQLQHLSAIVTTGADAPISNSFRQRDVEHPIVHRDLGGQYRGHLGNQLWQIAGTLGIAATLNANARFPDWPYKDRFSIPNGFFSTEPLVGWDAEIFALHIAQRHRPFLQDPALWRHIEPTIHDYFAPGEQTRVDLESKFAEILAIPAKTALHVRRGDYLDQPDRHPTPSERYFRAAVEVLSGKNIVVFSDDIDWCREHLSWARPTLFMEGGADYEDLLLMTRCEHHIISNSSFSWWGAFLSRDRKTIFPRRWYGPEYRDADPTLMFLDGWVGIDC